MARFRFRAQAALDLRTREHDVARRALATAEVAHRGALAALEITVLHRGGGSGAMFCRG